MKLIFLTDSIIPSQRASALHLRALIPHLFAKFNHSLLLSQQGEGQWEEFKSVEHQVIKTPKLKGGLWLLMFRFRQNLQSTQADIIYSRFALLPLFFKRLPYFLELHSDIWHKSRMHSKAIKIAVSDPYCCGFVCITQAIREDLIVAFPELLKSVEVIPDAASFPLSQYEISFKEKSTLNIGYVGSFHKGKGVELVLQLARKLPEHNFVIIGGSELQVEEYRSKSSSNVRFLGFIDQSEIWKEMTNIDICLLPNQSIVKTGKKSEIGKYTSPLKMFEYMAYSKPIIASDLPVLREVLNEEIALLANPTDLSEWVKAVRQLEAIDKRKELGEKAFQIFEAKYSWQKRADHIFEFINSQLKK